ncbi:MAG: VOC family protein [Candidatus Phaeomarinobacter sp.]
MKMSQPTPELAVPDVRKAQEYYRDRLGFEIAWHNEEGRIGAVSHGDCAIFFRESSEESRPGVFWIFSEDVDDAHTTLTELGADIVEALADTPWGTRQFTIRDVYGNIFYIFHEA